MATFVLTVANPDGTGVSKMAELFGIHLRRRGHRVVFAFGSTGIVGGRASLNRASFVSRLDDAGMEIRDLPTLHQPVFSTASRDLARLLRDENAAAVVGFHVRDQLLALLTSRRSHVPAVIAAQTVLRFWGPPPVRVLKKQLFRYFVSRNTTLAVCTSEVVQSELVQDYGLSPCRGTVVPNGIDLSTCQAFEADEVSRMRHRLGVGDDDLLLVNVGRLDPQKGQDVLIRAFAALNVRERRLKLLLIGAVVHSAHQKAAEAFERRLHELVIAQGLEDRVIFAGWRDDIPLLQAASDVYVHAARWEGPPLCLSVLEAMAASRPVISTDCSGWPEGFENSTHGYIASANNVTALRDAMEKVTAHSAEERQRMGEAARRLVEARYDIAMIGDRFVDVVEAAVGLPSTQTAAAARADHAHRLVMDTR